MYHLSTTRFVQHEPEAEKQAETGWDRVSGGIGKVLFGNLLIIGSVVMMVVLMVWVSSVLPKIINSKKATWEEAVFLLGMAGMGLLMLYAYITIIVGKWKCVMSAPERCGAKWLMFASITCMVVGPAMGIATDLGNVGGSFFDTKASRAQYARMQREMFADGLSQKELWALATPALVMSVVGALVSITGEVCFLLFLRAVGRCFDDYFHVRHVEIYLIYLIALTVGTVALPFGLLVMPGIGVALIMLGLGLGWLLSFLWYLLLLTATTTCILRNAPQSRPTLGLR